MPRNTELILCSDVPLDPSYRNTIVFGSRDEQASYFRGKGKKTVSDSSYQRVNKGSMRVQGIAGNLYDVNYLMFRNMDKESRWFYAFVTKVEYINDGVVELTYQLDILQTWWFDFSLTENYVERMTPNGDGWGTHRLSEPITFPDTMYEFRETGTGSSSVETLAYCFGTTEEINGSESASPSLLGACPQGTYIYMYKEFSSFSLAISTAVKAKDGNVQFAFCIPLKVYEKLGGKNGLVGNVPDRISFDLTVPESELKFNDHSAKWNKTRGYPYSALICLTPNGYQEFDPFGFSGDAVFEQTFTISPSPSYVITTNYRDKTVQLDGGSYPQIPFSNSQYSQFVLARAQATTSMLNQSLTNASGMATTAVTSLASGGVSGMGTAGNLAGAVAGGIAAAGQTLVEQGNFDRNMENITTQYARSAPSMHGSSSDYGLALIGRNQPRFWMRHLNNEAVNSLDSFFDLKGYALNKIMTPPRNTGDRKFRYIQCMNTSIKGSVPANHAADICRIFNSGVTLWNSGGNVGNYS